MGYGAIKSLAQFQLKEHHDLHDGVSKENNSL